MMVWRKHGRKPSKPSWTLVLITGLAALWTSSPGANPAFLSTRKLSTIGICTTRETWTQPLRWLTTGKVLGSTHGLLTCGSNLLRTSRKNLKTSSALQLLIKMLLPPLSRSTWIMSMTKVTPSIRGVLIISTTLCRSSFGKIPNGKPEISNQPLRNMVRN